MSQKKVDLLVLDDVVRVEVTGAFLDNKAMALLFTLLVKEGISIDLLCFAPATHQPSSLIFSVCNQDFSKVLKATAQIKKNTALRIVVQGGYSKITLCGTGFPREAGIACSCLSALITAGTETALIAASGADLSLLVQIEDLDKTLSCLETVFHIAYEM